MLSSITILLPIFSSSFVALRWNNQRVYEVLIDPDQRRHYDECGTWSRAGISSLSGPCLLTCVCVPGGRTDDGGNIHGAAFGGLSFAELYAYFRDLHQVFGDAGRWNCAES